jgi:sugar phosphate isomerase/epimerase
MNRRNFLGTITAATLLTRRFGWSVENRKIEKIGVQLHTVRGEMKQDFEGTLAKVAGIGYREVEFAGYFDHSPKDVRAILDRHELVAPSAHVDYNTLDEKWPGVLDAAKVIGHTYIVCPSIPEGIRSQPEGWKRAAEKFNRAAEASKKAGVQFAYHNHWFEFDPVSGKMPYDILLTECDPKLVKMEMDLCWISVGRQDPLKYFDRYPGRFPLVHVKDLKKIPQVSASGGQNLGDSLPEMTEVGSGIIDWKRIFVQSARAGIQHYFVEHDNPASPLASIKTSFDYLQRLRF